MNTSVSAENWSNSKFISFLFNIYSLFFYSFIHLSFLFYIYSIIHSSIYSFIYPSCSIFILLFIYSFIHSFILPIFILYSIFILLFFYSFIHSFILPIFILYSIFILLFIYSFIHPVLYLSIFSFIHLSIHRSFNLLVLHSYSISPIYYSFILFNFSFDLILNTVVYMCCLKTHLFVFCISIYPAVRSIYLSIYPYIHLTCIHPSIYQSWSIHSFIYLSSRLSIHVSMNLSIIY